MLSKGTLRKSYEMALVLWQKVKLGTDESIYHSLFAFCRLSFCKVTDDGGSSLVSALNLKPCSLKDLDLSFNNLTDDIVQMLKENQ